MILPTRTEAPPPTKMPRWPSGNWKKALLSATRTWVLVASSSPPPTTAPCSADTTGRPPNWIFWKTLCHHWECCSTSKGERIWCSDRSRPAEKCAPSPEITTTVASLPRLSKQASMSCKRPLFTALRLAGRLSRMWAMLFSMLTRMFS
jgi:hypothetical protein